MNKKRKDYLLSAFKLAVPSDYNIYISGLKRRASKRGGSASKGKHEHRPLVSNIPILISQRVIIDGEPHLRLEWPGPGTERRSGIISEAKATCKTVDLSSLGIPFVYSPSRMGQYFHDQLEERDIPIVHKTQRLGMFGAKYVGLDSPEYEASGMEHLEVCGFAKDFKKQMVARMDQHVENALCVSLSSAIQQRLSLPSVLYNFVSASSPMMAYAANAVWMPEAALQSVRPGRQDYSRDWVHGTPLCFTGMTEALAHDLVFKSRLKTFISHSEERLSFDRALNIPCHGSPLFDISSAGHLGREFCGSLPSTQAIKKHYDLALEQSAFDCQVAKLDERWAKHIAAVRVAGTFASQILCGFTLDPLPSSQLSSLTEQRDSDELIATHAVRDCLKVISRHDGWGEMVGQEYRMTADAFELGVSNLPWSALEVKRALFNRGRLRKQPSRGSYSIEVALGQRYALYLDQPNRVLTLST